MDFVATLLLWPLKFLEWLGPRRRGGTDDHMTRLYALRRRMVLWWLTALLGFVVAYLLGSSANGLQPSPTAAPLWQALNVASDVAFAVALLGCAVATYCRWRLYRFEVELFGD
jgi:hypothetical protein